MRIQRGLMEEMLAHRVAEGVVMDGGRNERSRRGWRVRWLRALTVDLGRLLSSLRPRGSGGWGPPIGSRRRVRQRRAAVQAGDRRFATDSVLRAAGGSGRPASAAIFASTDLS